MKRIVRIISMLLLAAAVNICFFACEKDKNKNEWKPGDDFDDNHVQTPWLPIE